MKYAQWFYGGVVASGVVLAGCGSHAAEPRPPARIETIRAGARARDFRAQDIDGRTISLSSYLRKDVVLLTFCSTWCEPCVAEFPHLRRIYEQNRENGFVILAISLDGPETVANVPGFARRNHLLFPMVIDADSNIATLYNPKKTAPLGILIDRAGTIVAIHEGYTPGDEEQLSREIASALGMSSQAL